MRAYNVMLTEKELEILIEAMKDVINLQFVVLEEEDEPLNIIGLPELIVRFEKELKNG